MAVLDISRMPLGQGFQSSLRLEAELSLQKLAAQ